MWAVVKACLFGFWAEVQARLTVHLEPALPCDSFLLPSTNVYKVSFASSVGRRLVAVCLEFI